MAAREELHRRADYTHQFNKEMGRHGWLRMTPAYSVKVVDELLARQTRPLRVLDPFCGTATTALSASYHGHQSATMDINPFLVWLGRVKTARYSAAAIASARSACASVIEAAESGTIKPAKAPPIHNIGRWWSPDALDALCALRAGIRAESRRDAAERCLLDVAFCRTLIGLSNAAFNHQSMSFKDARPQGHSGADASRMFSADVSFVLEGAMQNPEADGRVVLGDARRLSDAVGGPFDLVVTSPPYANRMSYIRELRPYMYWLGFLSNGHDAGDLDWSGIGGTWGVATSRLTGWKRQADSFRHPRLDIVLEKMKHHDYKSGKILANYVAKYFEDMWAHFKSLVAVLSDGAEIHYIIGNSTFYGILLPVERIYAAMLERLGFHNVVCRAIRKRNSKKDLVEFDVSARWN